MKNLRQYWKALSALALATAVAPAVAQQLPFAAHLNGYEEAPLTINAPGDGDFKAVVSADRASIAYMLTFRNMSSNVTQSHIHFGRPAIAGGVVLFLCTNLTPPAGVPTPPACPTSAGTIFGTLTAADVIAVPGQGIDGGAAGFAQMVAAMSNGAAYANVHTTLRPSGEIRARLAPLPVDQQQNQAN
jgi:CHRD domain